MPKTTLKINSVLGGIGPSYYFASQGQYHAGIGIDPDLPLTSSDIRTSGAIVPTVYEKFSSTPVNAEAVSIVNNPKNTLTYVALTNGKLISYDSSLASETTVGTVTGSVSNGMWQYNNYLYIPTGTDVSRYGPLNNSPALTNTVWTGATLGSLTALTNTTYPSLRGQAIPNHWGCVHGDGASYFLDFKNGQGMVHKIKTSKTTDEGDTNNGSAYNVLDLPFGFYPTCITSFSTDLAILAIQATDATINQGKACLFLWDPTNTETFYRQVYLPDPLATAMEYINGRLYIWTGNAQNGVRLSQYVGGDTVSDVTFLEEGAPPFAGAVDAFGDRVVWGGYTTYPTSSACVFAFGSKNSNLPKGLHNIVKTTSSGSTQNTTAVKFVQQASNITPRVIAAWRDGSGYGIDKLSTSATYGSTYRSEVFQIGQKFSVLRLRIPLGAAVAANMTVTPKIYVDDGSSSTTLTAINNTNYSGKRAIVYKVPEMSSIIGTNNLFLELSFTGTVACPVSFPIEIGLETFGDE